MAQLSRKLAGS